MRSLYLKIASTIKEPPREFIESLQNDPFIRELFEEFQVPFEKFDDINELLSI